MSNASVFISHSSKEDDFVRELRATLESYGLVVRADSSKLRSRARLAPEIQTAIAEARSFIAIISPHTVNSPRVRKEIHKALEVERERKGDGYRVIPLLLPGIEPSALALWFDEEPAGIRVETRAGGLDEALPQILAALGERLPTDRQPVKEVASQPVEELILRLDDLKIETKDDKRRAQAIARLVYQPANESAREVESRKFIFTAPLGVIEAEDLRWYLEEYFVWPLGIFKERAERIEKNLPVWGQELYEAALATPVAAKALDTWRQAGTDVERRFSVFVDSELPDGASEEEQVASREAATEMLSLPWELLHDGNGFLFHGNHPVRVRRRLPNRYPQPVRPTQLPIRILLVSPRPEDELTGYFDHRSSAKTLVEATESLGELAQLSVLTPPTFSGLGETLRQAAEENVPFDVIHFDGHGVFDYEVGAGGLCFEDPDDVQKIAGRAVQLVHAEKLAEVIRDHRIPLIFLDACQTATTEADPTASVAGQLLQGGVTSIVAMSHTVLVETAQRFVKAFYQELAQGKRVGAAMLAGQRELYQDTYRGKMLGAGNLHLQDWFVPVLYQEEQDRQLVTRLQPAEVRQLMSTQRRLQLGALPAPPAHGFQGRSRELLMLERLLHQEPYAVLRGLAGEGKTTIVVELARWLVRTGRFRRAAFVSLEQYTGARSVLDSLGRQLLPGGDAWSVAEYSELKEALQPVKHALAERATIIVLDNLESVLPDHRGQLPPGIAPIEELFHLCQELLDADPATRIVFTSRESLPTPFDNQFRETSLGALSREDAIKLVVAVMKQEGLTPESDAVGGEPQEIIDLVEAANCHARALTLLAHEGARRGLRVTTENMHQLMAELDKNYPGDRENSLYASVELSLRRLSPETREKIKALGVFHGGAHLSVWAQMLDANPETINSLANQLFEVGLAETVGYGYLRLDPALPPYLLREMSEEEQEKTKRLWAEGMREMTHFLYEQRSKNAELSARLTLLEMPNLIAALLWAQDKDDPEEVVAWAISVETILAQLGRPQALAQATKVREQAAGRLGKWSHARFLAESANVDRLLEQNDLLSAYSAAQQLLQRCLAAGEEAHASAAYDIAFARWQLGKVISRDGIVEPALEQLGEARRQFQVLADAGNSNAEHMVSASLTEIGDCLKGMGRWNDAAKAYQEVIIRAEKVGDMRTVAVCKGSLGTIYSAQEEYPKALESYTEAQSIFESLGEQKSVATAWHQIGIVYRKDDQFEEAEWAYRQALAISVKQNDLAGEARSLNELGTLYDSWDRLEEAVKCHRRATQIAVKLDDQSKEGLSRSRLADTLIKLERYDEARREVMRAIECVKPYGYAAEPWQIWAILQNLEQVTDNPQAAAQARQQAFNSYLAYRHNRGQSSTTVAQFCDLAAQVIPLGKIAQVEQLLAEYSEKDAPPSFKLLLSKLQAVLHGDRNPALVDDPNLEYDDAVELQLLLEALGGKVMLRAQEYANGRDGV